LRRQFKKRIAEGWYMNSGAQGSQIFNDGDWVEPDVWWGSDGIDAWSWADGQPYVYLLPVDTEPQSDLPLENNWLLVGERP
jgi:hypothetical protein